MILHKMAAYFFVIILFSWFWIPILYFVKLFFKKRRAFQRFPEIFNDGSDKDFNGFTCALVFLASIFIIFYLRIIFFTKYDLPAGPDQASYMYILKTAENNPSLLLFGGDLAPGNMYYLIYSFPFFPTYFLRVLGWSLESLLIVTSLFYGILHSSTIYLFIKESINYKSLALIAFLTTSLSLSSLITSSITFRFIIVIICLYIILTLMFKTIRFIKNEYAFLLCAVFITSVTVYPEFTLVIIPVLIGLVFLIYANSREIGKRILYLMLQVGVSTLIFIIIIFFLLFLTTGRLKIPLIQDVLMRIKDYKLAFPPCIDPVYFINFYSTGWFSNLVENPAISALAILGLVYLIFSKRNIFRDFLLVWIMMLTFLATFFPVEVIHRVYYLLPMNIVSAIGILVILSITEKALKEITRVQKIYLFKITILTIVFLIALNHNLEYIKCTIPSSRFFWSPSITEEHLEALKWIKENYKNGKVIILMDKRALKSPHRFFVSWVQYILETRIKNPDPYIGDFSDFLLGKPSSSLPNVAFNNTPAYPNLENYIVVTLLDDWLLSFYEKDFVIKQVFNNEYGLVYRLTNLTEKEKIFWANAWLMLKDLSPSNEFSKMLLLRFYDSFDSFEWKTLALGKNYTLIQGTKLKIIINESVAQIKTFTNEIPTLFCVEKNVKLNTTQAPFFQMRFRIQDASNGYYICFLDKNYTTIKSISLNEFGDNKWHVISLNLKHMEYINVLRFTIETFSAKNYTNAIEIDYIKIFDINN